MQLEDGAGVDSPSRPGFALLSSSSVFKKLKHYSIIDVRHGKEERQPYSTSLVRSPGFLVYFIASIPSDFLALTRLTPF
jgi:hypothetical protein